jgi:hypothetical protein
MGHFRLERSVALYPCPDKATVASSSSIEPLTFDKAINENDRPRVYEDKVNLTGTAIRYCNKMATFQPTPW